MILPRQLKAVVFDMDGLLFETETLFRAAMRKAGTEYQIGITDAFFASLNGLTREDKFVKMRSEFGNNFPAEAFHAQCHVHYRPLLESDLQLKSGATEMLDLLDTLKCPRAIATSATRSSVEHHLEHFGISHRFDAVIAHGDYPCGKPDPSPYLAAAQALCVAPMNCLALEDSHNGVRSAAGAGMMTIMVPDILPANDDMRKLTVHIAQDLLEVRNLLQA